MTTKNTNLRPGDTTPDGMIFVGADPKTGKWLLRSGFNKVSPSDHLDNLGPFGLTTQTQAIKVAAEDIIYGHPAGTLRLPTMKELHLIGATLSPAIRQSLGLVWSGEQANEHVGRALDMVHPDAPNNYMNAGKRASVCFVKTVAPQAAF